MSGPSALNLTRAQWLNATQQHANSLRAYKPHNANVFLKECKCIQLLIHIFGLIIQLHFHNLRIPPLLVLNCTAKALNKCDKSSFSIA